MLRKSLCFALGALCCASAWAVPAKNGVRTLEQPDGSTIQVRLMGDETSHYYIDLDGRQLTQNSEGLYIPATEPEMAETQSAARARRARHRLPSRAANNSQVPHINSPRIPVLLVQYADYKFKDADPVSTFEAFFAEGNKSAHQYFADQSNGKFTPQFDIYGPYTLSGKRVQYGGNDRWGYDVGVGNMVGEACQGLDSKIDYSLYDNDGDGECDVVIVLYAGDGEASSYASDCEDSVWPCQWDLYSSEFGKYLRLDGTKVNLFAVFNELYGSDRSKIDGIGTFCHEFSHCLGLPDFYDTQYSGDKFGMGPWSLMDYGSYNDDGFTPIGYSAYEKEFMGWISIPEVKENTYYTLPVMNQKSESTDVAVRITNDADEDEYYILENRAKTGWDKYIPAEGMMISHFTYDADAWNNNYVNDNDPQLATIMPADNNLKLNNDGSINTTSLLGDLWPQSYATELTDESTPAAKVNTGKYMHKPITEIVRNADGTISFWAIKSPLPVLEMPANLRHTQTDNNSVLLEWDFPEEIPASFTVEVSQYVENPYTLLDSVDFSDCSWTKTGYTEVSDGGLKFGSGKQNGTACSGTYKTDELHEGVTICFNAKSYSSDDSSVRVSILNGSGTVLSTKDVELTTSAKDYSLIFDLTGGSQFKVKFETTATKKRFYLYTASIYSGEMSADKAPAALHAPSVTYTGITGRSHHLTDLEEQGRYLVRVMAHPDDDETYASSPWSESYDLQMELQSSIFTPVISDEVEWFTVSGTRLNSRPTLPGLYIRRTKAGSSKIII